MAVYVIADISLSDAEAYRPYVEAVPPIVRKHGGEYLARGGAVAVLEGEWSPERLVVFRFPDRSAVHAFMADPAYAPWKALRQRLGRANIVLVDAVA